jgi:predicted RND superfamily exporter protein
MERLPGVRTVFSAADLPPEMRDLALTGMALPIGAMASDDGLRFMMLPETFTTDDLRGWVAFAEDSDEVRVLTGMPVLWDEIARLVLRAQIGSLIAAFALVTVMLFASYRRIRETLASLVPLGLTVATVLAFIAVSGIQLNLVTAVVSSIVIGVGIDYAIHFVAAIDNARPQGDGYVLRAVERAGRPIVANALGVALGLTGLWLSPLKVHPQISTIMWVSMIVAALCALLIIAALAPRDGVREPGR